jgi:coenzyme F420-reducing hydrogenase alpha subunit
MLCGQMVQSHSLHLYLLVLPDFVGASSSFELQKSHPEIFRNAIELKRYADKIIEIVGGRAVHPIASVPGGFKSFPKIEELKELSKSFDEITKIADNTARLFANIEMPKIERELVYSSLHRENKYSIYEGDIKTTDGHSFKSSDYTKYVYEELKPYTRAKFATLKNKVMYVGAAARMNINGLESLEEETRSLAKEFGLKTPFNNPFDNTIAQALENHHFVVRSIKLINSFIKNGVEIEDLRPPRHFGVGTAACEAPRGTLFHHYELNKDGFIAKCDLITPTVQSLTAMEGDMLLLNPLLEGLSPNDRVMIIEKLIRAYDPCITCATH